MHQKTISLLIASVLASFVACTSVPESLDIPNTNDECTSGETCDDDDPCTLDQCVRGSCTYAAVSGIECETNEGHAGECVYGSCNAIEPCAKVTECGFRPCTDRACVDGVCRYSTWKHDGKTCVVWDMAGVCSSGECRTD